MDSGGSLIIGGKEMKNEKILKGMLKEILLSVKELNTKLNALLVKEEDNVSRKDAYASLYEDGNLQMECEFEDPQDLEQFCYLKAKFELNDKDALELIKRGKVTDVCGIYKDTYDIGKKYVTELTSIPYWLDNDQSINYAKIGEDRVENSDAWMELPSGNYAHVSRKDAYAFLYEDGDLQKDLEQFCYLKAKFELNDKDALELIKCGIAANVRGVYKDTYDIGKLFVRELTNIPYWLDNDQFINYAKIGEDMMEKMENSCGWYKLPSGNYADLRL